MASPATQPDRKPGLPVLRLDGVTKSYFGKPALNRVSLSVPDNAYVSLLGSSGSGKTVLLRTIAGFETADQGTIALRGAPLNAVPAYRRNIGFVFQNFALFPHLNVFENVAFGLKNGGRHEIAPKTLAAKVNAMIELVGLGGLEKRAVGQISGGQRQRVALGRTLVTEPQLVLLDEPLGALDANLRTRMCSELRRIRERLGVTFLHVTGSESEALAMGDQVIVLDEGRIAQVGAPDEVYTRPLDARVARFLNCYNLIEGRMRPDGFEAEGRTLPCAQVGPTDAVYAVRQDMITVAKAGLAARPDVTALHATFVASEYSGPSVASFFRLPSGSLITVEDHLSHRDPQTFEPGTTYHLSWRVSDALLLSRGSDVRT